MKAFNIFLIVYFSGVLLIMVFILNDMFDAFNKCNEIDVDGNSTVFNECLAGRGWAPLGYEYRNDNN